MVDTGPSPSSEHGTPKPVRNLKACDLCRSRKVKCRYADGDTICQGCRLSGTECTQNKPRRKRGPAKRSLAQRSPNDTTVQAFSSPATPGSAGEAYLDPPRPDSSPAEEEPDDQSSQASPDPRLGDSDFKGLCSRSLILTILTDWSRYVYPLAPLLHRKKFLKRVLQHEDERNQTFCALVLSTCAMTVSTLRRRSFYNYPSVTVDKCIDIIERERMLLPVSYTPEWCLARYNFASSLSALYGLDDMRIYQAIKDAMAGVQWLLFHEKGTESVHDQEMVKRLYWLLGMWQLGTEIQGQPHLTFLPGPPFTQALQTIRPRPLSDAELGVPDAETNVSELWTAAPASWLKDDDQYITGLNSLADVLMVWERAKIDMAHKQPEETLRDGMARLQAVLDNLVPELRWRGGLARFPKPSRGHESQTVNILITCFYIRSNLLQHLGQAPGISHQSIVSDVLEVLEHMPEDIHECNGFTLVKKVRDIGAAYLQELRLTSGEPIQAVNESEQRIVNALLTRLERMDFRLDQENLCPEDDAISPAARSTDTRMGSV
ncbi:uncharacterized protein NECHADRAFT_85322 [Fusarium vanettenii 77-13-4]|uniref:Zn(2)-C6 fungal-type domain-containing protein n=1 Tax=Fusarium vanettenii (strain ATCC MYA-4622 / CBS 123669 / FGSC 9596 / NRRL 45880 / 77-13-4) TaxID=660122 RepID=C7ZJ11_FUSV7|nr:uncharacterized protein NECHADRAFT_85322 [Fusarium vanettenii 77-13-4]EEU35934.1 hypothetical protein NECHADRAFT_85322 [Fusarium vanettenii 77-13-4]